MRNIHNICAYAHHHSCLDTIPEDKLGFFGEIHYHLALITSEETRPLMNLPRSRGLAVTRSGQELEIHKHSVVLSFAKFGKMLRQVCLTLDQISGMSSREYRANL